MNKKILIVKKGESEVRLDRLIKKHAPNYTQSLVEKHLRKGLIKIDGKKSKSNYRVSEGEKIEIPVIEQTLRAKEKKERPKLSLSPDQIKEIQNWVIYKDKDIIAINKPYGIASQGGTKVGISVDGVLDYLKFDYEERPRLVHRIDKDTSGLMVIARREDVARKFGELFKTKNLKKTYLAVTVGVPSPREAIIKAPLLTKSKIGNQEKTVVDAEGKTSITEYKTLDHAGDKLALVELNPITGRTHQLRVHMDYLGTPILGDGKYGGKEAFISGQSNKLHLHAYMITILHGSGKKSIDLKAPLPKHFKDTLSLLGLEF